MRPPLRDLSHSFGFGRSLFENVGGHFFYSHAEFEHRGLSAAAPTGNLPVRAHELYICMRSQIEQQRRFFTIKFLRESGNRLRAPGSAVGGTEDAEIERLLLDDLRDGERDKKYPAGGTANIDGGSVAFGADQSVRCDESCINHGERILTNLFRCVVRVKLFTAEIAEENFYQLIAPLFRRVRSGEITAARFLHGLEIHQFHPHQVRIVKVQLPFAVSPELRLLVAVRLPAV